MHISAVCRAAQARPSLRAPSGEDLRDLARTCGPTTALYVAKNACYIVLQAAATALPPMAVAAHQPARPAPGSGASTWLSWCLQEAALRHGLVMLRCACTVVAGALLDGTCWLLRGDGAAQVWGVWNIVRALALRSHFPAACTLHRLDTGFDHHAWTLMRLPLAGRLCPCPSGASGARFFAFGALRR